MESRYYLVLCGFGSDKFCRWFIRWKIWQSKSIKRQSNAIEQNRIFQSFLFLIGIWLIRLIEFQLFNYVRLFSINLIIEIFYWLRLDLPLFTPHRYTYKFSRRLYFLIEQIYIFQEALSSPWTHTIFQETPIPMPQTDTHKKLVIVSPIQ